MRGEGVVRRRILSRSTIALLVLALILAAEFAHGNGSDLPPQIVLRGFLKPEDGRLVLLVRIPLVLLAGFSLPKRGPGYLDLARVDVRLAQAVAAAARQIELFEGNARLSPTRADSRLSLPSDASFESFAAARAHLSGPTLPIDTDLYWNQGFLDAELEYPITSARADFSVRVSMAPELADRIKLSLEFLSTRGPVRSYDLPGRSALVRGRLDVCAGRLRGPIRNQPPRLPPLPRHAISPVLEPARGGHGHDRTSDRIARRGRLGKPARPARAGAALRHVSGRCRPACRHRERGGAQPAAPLARRKRGGRARRLRPRTPP